MRHTPVYPTYGLYHYLSNLLIEYVLIIDIKYNESHTDYDELC